MINIVHYFAIGLFIFGCATEIKVFFSMSAGLFIGLGCGYWWLHNQENKKLKMMKKYEKENES